MFYQSKKVKPWSNKDYAVSITLFVVHTLVTALLFGVVLLANSDYNFTKVSEFITSDGEMNNIIYVFLSICLVSAGMFLYFYNEYRDFLLNPKHINLVFIIIETSLIISYIVGRYVSVYARPFALCALLALLLINRRTAIFMNIIFSIFVFMMDAYANSSYVTGYMLYSSLILGFSTSLLAIYLVYGVSSRLKVFLMGFALAVPVTASCICLEFQMFLSKPVTVVLYGFTSGMLSVVLMMALLPFFEKTFNMLTDYRLSEITDHKSTLIKMLIQNAPGTFNHSLVVSTLAESCANAIGENALLARACAYYHDIGKLKQPEYFTENQSGYNPHNELTPELSTDIIRSHAKDGYDLIRKYRLPQILADVALQHHGTLPISYFYAKAMKYTEGDLDIENFSYTGPKPQTRVAAIIMIADGCEAKVRTLSDRSHANVDTAVREIIEDRMSFEQFSECEITLKEIDIIRRTITNALAGVYHDRVEYPKLKIESNAVARRESEKTEAEKDK